jgi:hypothetical protein
VAAAVARRGLRLDVAVTIARAAVVVGVLVTAVALRDGIGWRGRCSGRRRGGRRWRGDRHMHRPGMVVAMVSRGGLRRRRGRAGCGLAVRRSGWFRRGVMRCHGGAAARGQRRYQYEPGRLSGMGERHDLSFYRVTCDGSAAAVRTPLTRTVTGCRSAQSPFLDVASVTDPSAWGPVYGTGQLRGGSGARRSRQAVLTAGVPLRGRS